MHLKVCWCQGLIVDIQHCPRIGIRNLEACIWAVAAKAPRPSRPETRARPRPVRGPAASHTSACHVQLGPLTFALELHVEVAPTRAAHLLLGLLRFVPVLFTTVVVGAGPQCCTRVGQLVRHFGVGDSSPSKHRVQAPIPCLKGVARQVPLRFEKAQLLLHLLQHQTWH